MRMGSLSRAIAVALVLLSAFFQAPAVDAGDYRVRKSADGLTFDIAIDRNPPVQGKNGIRLSVKDAEGKPAPVAEVTVNYFMPPMPNMPPMNYTVPAGQDGSEYRAVMDLVMAGPWTIVVRARGDARWTRVSFPIDVR